MKSMEKKETKVQKRNQWWLIIVSGALMIVSIIFMVAFAFNSYFAFTFRLVFQIVSCSLMIISLVFLILSCIFTRKVVRIIMIVSTSVSAIFIGFFGYFSFLISMFGVTWEKENKEYAQKYGTVQLFLEQFSYYEYNWISTKDNPYQNDKEKCYDSSSEFYTVLYNHEYSKSSQKALKNSTWNRYFVYNVPCEDFANITIYDNGELKICVAPDLAPGYDYYFKTDISFANNLINRANEILNDFYVTD